MSEKPFALEEDNVKSLSPSQLTDILLSLKYPNGNTKVIEILRFLHLFVTTIDSAADQLLEGGIVPIISNIITSDENLNVQILSEAVLKATTLKSSNTRKNCLASDGAILACVSLLNEEPNISIQAINAIIHLFENNPNSTQSLFKCTALVVKFTDFLLSKDVPNGVKTSILNLLAKIVEINSHNSEDDATEEGFEELLPFSSFSSSSSSSSFSCSSSSSTSSAGLPVLTTFRGAIRRMAITVASLGRIDDTGLRCNVDGFVAFLKRVYGEEIFFDSALVDISISADFCADVSGLAIVSGNQCGFRNPNVWHTVTVNRVMDRRRGNYRIDIRVNKISSADHAMIGVLPVSQKNKVTYITNPLEAKGCAIYLHTGNTILLYLNAGKTVTTNAFASHPFQDGTIISVEVDLSARASYFFVNKKLFTHYIPNLPNEPLFFALSGYAGGEFEIVSLKKLGRCSVSANAIPTAASLL